MKIALLIALLGLATSTTITAYSCSCAQAVNSTDCLIVMKRTCFWTGTACRTATCADVASPTYSSCQSGNAPNCALNNSAVCSSFTTCASYTVAVSSNCYYVGSSTQSCVPGTQGSTGTYTCQNATTSTTTTTAPVCSTGTITSCSSLSNSAGSCAWNYTTTTCVVYSAPTQCSDLTPYGSTYCSGSRCSWVSAACVTATCANQATCAQIMNWDRTTTTLCAGSPCAEVAITTLTSANCASTSYSGAIWSSSNVCTVCYAYALFASFLLVLLF